MCLIGPSSRRRTCAIGTIVSPGSRSAESATSVYNAHPYFSNRSPAWVTIASRGIGPNTATLRLPPERPSVFIIISGHLAGCLRCSYHCQVPCGDRTEVDGRQDHAHAPSHTACLCRPL